MNTIFHFMIYAMYELDKSIDIVKQVLPQNSSTVDGNLSFTIFIYTLSSVGRSVIAEYSPIYCSRTQALRSSRYD